MTRILTCSYNGRKWLAERRTEKRRGNNIDYNYEIVRSSDALPVNVRIYSVNEIELHWHKFIELIMVLEGSISISNSSSSTTLKQGDFILINSNEIHKTTKTDEHNLLLAVHINLDFYTSIHFGITNVYFDCNSYAHGEELAENCNTIRKLLARLIRELNRQGLGYRSRLGSCLFLLMGEILYFPFYKMADIKDKNSDADLARLQRIIEYISQNLQQRLTLKEIAQSEHLSYYYLSHFIQDKLGISFQKYLTQVRLDKAIELMLFSDKSMSVIAEEVGFASATAFNKNFKKELGISPNEYRTLFFKRYMKYKPDKLELTNNSNTRVDNNVFPSAASAAALSQTYQDVNQQTALRYLFSYLTEEDTASK